MNIKSMTKEEKSKTLAAFVVGIVLLSTVIPALVSAKSTLLAIIGLLLGAGFAYLVYKHIWPIIIREEEVKNV